MAISKKSFVNLDLQGNSLVNPTIGLNSDMTKAGSFQYNSVDNRLEYFNGSTIETVANLGDVTGALDFQGGYDAATNTPDLTNPVSGAIKKGYYWVVTAAGTFFGEPLAIGDSLFAQVDNPASLGDWVIVQGNLDLATDTVAGISRLATQTEVNDGTEGGAVVVTPATLQGKIDTQITPVIDSKLPLSGGTMSGTIDMGGNNVTGVGAVSTSQLDSGSTLVPVNLASDLNFNSNSNNPSLRKKIVNLTSPTDDYDGANKIYVDDTAATAQANAETSANTYTDEKIAAQSLTIPITGWFYDGDGGYYANIQMPYDNAIAQVYETSTNDLIDTAITIGGTTILIFSNIQISDNAWTVRVVKTIN